MLGDAWGLGWELMDTNLGTMIGHDGNTIGQASFLRVLPEHGIAIALLTNGGDVYPLYREIFAHVLGELAGLEYKELPTPPENPERIDASGFVGTYGASVMDLKVSQDEDGRIFIDMIPKGMAIEMGDSDQRSEYVSFGGNRIISLEPTSGMFMPFAFLGDDGEGNARFLHIGRAHAARRRLIRSRRPHHRHQAHTHQETRSSVTGCSMKEEHHETTFDPRRRGRRRGPRPRGLLVRAVAAAPAPAATATMSTAPPSP